MGWEWGLQDAIGSPNARDVAAVVLVCGVIYAMRHAGSTVIGFVDRLEALRRAARP